MAKYTEAIHARQVLRMLEDPNPCSCCPGAFGMAAECAVCRGFVGCTDIPYKWCPCQNLGPREAIKRTWLALEEKGYLNGS